MRVRLAVLWVLIIVLIPCSLFAATVSAKGVVVDSRGACVPGIKVYAVRSGSVDFQPTCDIPARTVTDGQGRFRFDALPAPAEQWTGYSLVAYDRDKRLGWTRGKGDLVANMFGVMEEPAPHEGYRIVLPDLVPTEGRVVDQDGKPVAGAVVKPKWFGTDSADSSSISARAMDAILKFPSATTDDAGVFRFARLPQAQGIGYTVTKRGYARVYDSKTKDIVLGPAGDITGRVVDEKGKPVAGAKVATGLGETEATTRKDGTYVIENVPVGERTVTAYFSGFHVADAIGYDKRVQVSAGQTTRVRDLVVPHRVTVTGRVLDAKTGKPIPNAHAVAEQQLHDKTSSRVQTMDWTAADTQGVYKLQVVPGMEVSIGAEHPLYKSDYKIITVPESDTRGPDIRLEKEPVAKGKVVDKGGRPVRGAELFIAPGVETGKYSPTQSSYAHAASDAQGIFEIALPGSDSEVRITAHKACRVQYPSYDLEPKMALAVWRSVDRERALKDGITLVVEPPRKLTITVKGPSGHPVPDAMIFIAMSWPGRKTDMSAGWHHPFVKTDEKGAAVYDNAVVGATYDLRVHIDGQGFQEPIIELPAVGSPEWKDSIEIVLKSQPDAK